MAILEFPPVHLANEHGILAVGGDLEISSLVLAYKSGVFPWPINDEYPLAWFAPDPRGVLFLKDVKINRSLNKFLNKTKFTVSFNQAFEKVINECSSLVNRTGQQGTWITDELKQAYIALNKKGLAYSVEIWDEDQLVGGLYGVCIDKFISGESMFYRKPNASKMALVALFERMKELGNQWIDTQMCTPTLSDFGAKEISRDKFMLLLSKVIE